MKFTAVRVELLGWRNEVLALEQYLKEGLAVIYLTHIELWA